MSETESCQAPSLGGSLSDNYKSDVTVDLLSLMVQSNWTMSGSTLQNITFADRIIIVTPGVIVC